MSFSFDSEVYVGELEEQLRLMLFGGAGNSDSGAPDAGAPDAEAAVLLVRGALAEGNHSKAVWLLKSTQQLAAAKPGRRDMAAAAAHVRGLVDRDPACLEQAASTYSAPLARAKATEDAGLAWAGQGNQDNAVAWLRGAYALYEELGTAGAMARVRAQLRAAGVRLHHWKRADKPAYGWQSLTETEERIADLVANGLSNRQVAGRLFLSTHTVAFHLRHIYWKLDVNSRVQLARLAAEQAQAESALSARAGRTSQSVDVTVHLARECVAEEGPIRPSNCGRFGGRNGKGGRHRSGHDKLRDRSHRGRKTDGNPECGGVADDAVGGCVHSAR